MTDSSIISHSLLNTRAGWTNPRLKLANWVMEGDCVAFDQSASITQLVNFNVGLVQPALSVLLQRLLIWPQNQTEHLPQQQVHKKHHN